MSLLKPDEEVLEICLARIRRKSRDIESWQFTILDAIHKELYDLIKLSPSELPVVSFYSSEDSWYVMTTRRLIGQYQSESYDLPIQQVVKHDFGLFKGLKNQTTNIVKFWFKDDTCVEFAYETGKASMAPIYAVDYLSRDHFHHDN